jgi:Mg2+ and Co2+ transporter CorA
MNIEQVANVVDAAIDRLPYMESLYEQANDEVEKMQDKRQWMLNDIDILNDKIFTLRRTAYSLEQNCRRKEDPEITQKFNDPKEIMKIVVASVVNYIQASVNDTISSSNPTLSLPLPSSATLPVQFNQNDTFLNQESEIHEMHKGDIID